MDEAQRREAGGVGQRLGLLVAEELMGEAAETKGEPGDGRGGEGQLPLTAVAKEHPHCDNQQDEKTRERASDERTRGCALRCPAHDVGQGPRLGGVVRH